MTVSSQTNNATFVGNGVTTVFPLPFRFFANGDVFAYFIDSTTGASTPMVLGTDYTLTGAGEPEVNGNAVSVLTTTVPLANGRGLYVERIMQEVQSTDIVNQGEFFASTHEDVFDRLTMQIQQANSGVNGAIRVAVGDPNPARLPSALLRANKILSFDENGEPEAIDASRESSLALRQELSDASDPTKGAALIGYKGRTLDVKLADIVSVADFPGADRSGLLSSVAAFNSAALASPTVLVPAGTWLIDSAVATSAYWVIEAGAVITGLATTGAPFNIDDTRRLPGRMIKLENGTHCGLRVGDTDPWLERTIWPYSESIAELSCVSSTGNIGVMGASRTSDDPVANMACIALGGYAVNDNTANVEPSWAMYLNSYRKASTGAAYNIEADNINYGNVFDLDPYSTIGLTTTQTVNLWITAGGGDSGASNVSAGLSFRPNPKKFNRGIVFADNSLQTNDAIASPLGYQWSWYSSAGVINSYISHREIKQKTVISSALGNVWTISKWRDLGAASVNLDSVWRANYFGCSGSSTDYLGAYSQVMQRGNFSGGNARFSYDISAKDDAGTDLQISLNGLGNKSFAPYPDNSISLGVSGLRWSVVYAATGTINTSDERAKQDIDDIDERVLKAWAKVKYCQFKFRDAAIVKGDGARWHFGLIAQRVKEAFESEGLDAEAYGLLCHDTWEAQEEVLGENGEVISPKIEAGDRYGIRYEEALALECAYLRSKIEAMELPHD